MIESFCRKSFPKQHLAVIEHYAFEPIRMPPRLFAWLKLSFLFVGSVPAFCRKTFVSTLTWP
jgi:hypothetical protein